MFVDSATGAEQALPVQGARCVRPRLARCRFAGLNQVVGSSAAPSQLWRLAYPSGAVTRLTNDLSSYVDVSITAARDSLVTTKTDRRVADLGERRIGSQREGSRARVRSRAGRRTTSTWAADRLLFTSTIGGHRAISSVGQDGGTPQEVVDSRRFADVDLRWPDGCVRIDRSRAPWPLEGHGRGPARAVDDRASGWPSVTRDDRRVVFTSAQAAACSPCGWSRSTAGRPHR